MRRVGVLALLAQCYFQATAHSGAGLGRISKKKRAQEAAEDEKRVKQDAHEHRGKAVCTCNCEIWGEGDSSGMVLPPVWNEREFPGQVVNEMERKCIEVECPRLYDKCVDNALGS